MGDQTRKPELPLLTGLRGLAVGIVVVSHSANLGLLPSVFGFGFGQIGVMIFFTLSGFLMAYLYLCRAPDRANIIAYASARVGRVVPLYVAVVIASLAITTLLYGEFHYAFGLDDPMPLAQTLLFIRAPYELWTIPVEVQFYVVFAVMWLLYPRFGRRAIAVIAAAVLVPAVAYYALFHSNPAILPMYGYPFFLGVATAVFLPKLKRILVGRLPSVLGLILLAAVLVNLPVLRERLGLSLAPGKLFASTWLDPVTLILVYALFLACVLNLRSLGFLDSRTFVFLGTISYGLYLVHRPILEIVTKVIGATPLALFVGVGAAVALAWLSHRFFEAPTMRAIRRLGSRQRTASDPTSR